MDTGSSFIGDNSAGAPAATSTASGSPFYPMGGAWADAPIPNRNLLAASAANSGTCLALLAVCRPGAGISCLDAL